MTYFRVIPAFRAPRTIAGFDYMAPTEKQIAVGDLVRIPFRKQTVVGLVAEQLQKTAVPKNAIKEIIGTYADLRVTPKTLTLLQALAVRSFSSPASVLHAWIGTPPKKPKTTPQVVTNQSLNLQTTAQLLLNHWHHEDGVIASATRAVHNGHRVLILTPWTEHAKILAEVCNGTSLTSDVADGARFAAWAGFLNGNIRCLVATRIGAWLAAEADLVIVDEPENDDHKQDELAPRYDARWVANEANKTGTSVRAIGLTPRLTSSQQAPNAAAPTIPSTHITWVDTHRADWSDVAGLQGRALLRIEDAAGAGHPAIIVHPIHGLRARLRCADCGWIAACTRCGNGLTPERNALTCKRCHQQETIPATCPSCSGTDFSKSRPGRDAVIRDLQQKNLNATVFSIGEWNASFARMAQQSLVVLTDVSLLAGASEDIRKRERLIIVFRRLADVCAQHDAHLVIQGDAALLDDARTWLTSEGCTTALKREWDERNAFHLPPAARLVKLIIRGAQKTADSTLQALKKALPTNAVCDGPFAVERLPGTRTPRFIIHATFTPTTPDTTIQRVISPLLTTNILVDLDPIAFFE